MNDLYNQYEMILNHQTSDSYYFDSTMDYWRDYIETSTYKSYQVTLY